MESVQVFCPLCRDGVLVHAWQVADSAPAAVRPVCIRCSWTAPEPVRLLPLWEFARYGLPAEPTVVVGR